MRTTNSMLINNMLYYVNKNLGRMEQYQAQMATGKKIQVPSDNPVVAARALKFRTDVSEVEQYKSNANDAYSWMDTTEGTLGKMVDYLQIVREKGVYAGNTGTMNPGDRDKIAQEIIQIRDQMIHLANTTYAGRYVFSGYSTDKKLVNDDGTYNVTVSSNDTMAIKGTLVDPSTTAINTAVNNKFKISLDNGTYYDIVLPSKTYDGTAGKTLDTLVADLQKAINDKDPVLKDIQVINNDGRIELFTTKTTNAQGNKLKVYLQDDATQGVLRNLGMQVDPVTQKAVSKQEDINYQVGIGDLLNVNVAGTNLFGAGAQGDMGDFFVKLNRFIDTLSISDDKSYIIGQKLQANQDSKLDLTTQNKLRVQVQGMASFVDVTLNAAIYDGTPGKTLNDMAADMQAKLNAATGMTTLQVENRNGKLYISESTGKSITLEEGAPGEDALGKLKLYTDGNKTLSSVTLGQGISRGTNDAIAMMDRVLSVRADIGARMNRAELTINRLESEEINFNTLMSENEDVDATEVIMKLQIEENVYRASLSAGARIIMPTLVDFLR